MGYAPADDPQIAIYVVVDRPNEVIQDDAKFATRIVREILTEVLPYMGIFMTEEVTEKEREELEALQEEIMSPVAPEDTGEEGGEGTEEGGTGESGEGAGSGGTEGTSGEGTEGGSPGGGEGEGTEGESGEGDTHSEAWKSFPIDPETGYAKDPETGKLVDPETGNVVFGGGSTPAGLGGAGNGGDQEDNSPF